MTFYDIVVQGIGLLGAALAFTAFQCKRHMFIMIFKTLSTIAFIVQFGLLGAYTGLAMSIFGMVVFIGFAILVAKNVKTFWFVVGASIIGAVVGAFSWNGPASLLAIGGEIILTIACGIKNPQHVKYVCFFASACWLTYDIIFASLGGVISESFSIVSIIIATVRYFVAAKKAKKETPAE